MWGVRLGPDFARSAWELMSLLPGGWRPPALHPRQSAPEQL